MNTLPHLLLLLTFAACKGGSISTDSGLDDSAVDDTEVEGDADADSDSDSDTDADTDSDADADAETLTFDLGEDGAGVAVRLVHILSFESEDPFGDELDATSAAGTTATFTLGRPPAEQLAELDPDGLPGLYAAFYFAAAWDDTNGDATKGGSETYLGAGRVFPTYFEGDMPMELLLAGVVPGWNALEFVDGQDLPKVYPIEAIPLPLGLRPTPSYTLTGGVAEGIELTGRGLTVVPSVDGATTALHDQALTDPWSLTFSGAPPADHFDRDAGLGTAVEIPLSYLDLDGSGGLTEGDAAAEAVCVDDRTVAMLYVTPPTELYTAWVLTLQGLGTGWSGLSVTADGAVSTLNEDELGRVEVSGACAI
ncbi:hypothetical protein L6R49_19995 [Myxococcota bacterium]|nr:hypothetical protein [Myxococcota bacterium]